MSVRRVVIAFALLVPLGVGTAGAPGAFKPRPPVSPPAPTAPTNLRITASSATSVSLAWNASSGSSSSWWYCVQRDGLGCIRVDPPRTTITFTRLLPNTTFNWSVVAISSSGKRSASSNTVTYTTPPDSTPPSAPALSVTGLWPTRIALDWTASIDDVSQVSYTLIADGSPSPSNLIGWGDALILRLAPESTHTYQVVARDASGNTAASNSVTVTTPAKTDNTPPTAPTSLRLSSESAIPEIWLDWDPAADDSDPQSLIMYEVFLNGVLDHATVGTVETVTYCVGAGQNAITVRAVDTSGNASAFSNEIVFC
jgi:chitodextrinase